VQITKAPDELEKAIVATERYAEGQVSPTELFKAWTHWVGADPEADLVSWSLIRGISNYCKDVADRGGTSSPFTWVVANRAGEEFRHLGVAVAALLRDISGNPFRPVILNPGWLTPNVITLACTIYESRRFQALPILADALEEAGCADSEILGHCRGPVEHVRGCWVLDLILAKEQGPCLEESTPTAYITAPTPAGLAPRGQGDVSLPRRRCADNRLERWPHPLAALISFLNYCV
jgi:hypothetical protein